MEWKWKRKNKTRTPEEERERERQFDLIDEEFYDPAAPILDTDAYFMRVNPEDYQETVLYTDHVTMPRFEYSGEYDSIEDLKKDLNKTEWYNKPKTHKEPQPKLIVNDNNDFDEEKYLEEFIHGETCDLATSALLCCIPLIGPILAAGHFSQGDIRTYRRVKKLKAKYGLE